MDAMEEKVGNILNNPQMMQQIMSMAQALGQPQSPESTRTEQPGMPDFDPGLIQKVSGFAKQSSISRDEQALLKALGPYLSRDRICKLEKAMRAAKMAKFASNFLNSGALQLLTGR